MLPTYSQASNMSTKRNPFADDAHTADIETSVPAGNEKNRHDLEAQQYGHVLPQAPAPAFNPFPACLCPCPASPTTKQAGCKPSAKPRSSEQPKVKGSRCMRFCAAMAGFVAVIVVGTVVFGALAGAASRDTPQTDYSGLSVDRTTTAGQRPTGTGSATVPGFVGLETPHALNERAAPAWDVVAGAAVATTTTAFTVTVTRYVLAEPTSLPLDWDDESRQQIISSARYEDIVCSAKAERVYDGAPDPEYAREADDGWRGSTRIHDRRVKGYRNNGGQIAMAARTGRAEMLALVLAVVLRFLW